MHMPMAPPTSKEAPSCLPQPGTDPAKPPEPNADKSAPEEQPQKEPSKTTEEQPDPQPQKEPSKTTEEPAQPPTCPPSCTCPKKHTKNSSDDITTDAASEGNHSESEKDNDNDKDNNKDNDSSHKNLTPDQLYELKSAEKRRQGITLLRQSGVYDYGGYKLHSMQEYYDMKPKEKQQVKNNIKKWGGIVVEKNRNVPLVGPDMSSLHFYALANDHPFSIEGNEPVPPSKKEREFHKKYLAAAHDHGKPYTISEMKMMLQKNTHKLTPAVLKALDNNQKKPRNPRPKSTKPKVTFQRFVKFIRYFQLCHFSFLTKPLNALIFSDRNPKRKAKKGREMMAIQTTTTTENPRENHTATDPALEH